MSDSSVSSALQSDEVDFSIGRPTTTGIRTIQPYHTIQPDDRDWLHVSNHQKPYVQACAHLQNNFT